MDNRQGGFIGWLILIVIALAALKYFYDWSIFDAAASPEGQSTIAYIRNIFDYVWTYIKAPVTFAWNEIVWPIFSFAWDSFQAMLEWGRDNTSS